MFWRTGSLTYRNSTLRTRGSNLEIHVRESCLGMEHHRMTQLPSPGCDNFHHRHPLENLRQSLLHQIVYSNMIVQ